MVAKAVDAASTQHASMVEVAPKELWQPAKDILVVSVSILSHERHIEWVGEFRRDETYNTLLCHRPYHTSSQPDAWR